MEISPPRLDKSSLAQRLFDRESQEASDATTDDEVQVIQVIGGKLSPLRGEESTEDEDSKEDDKSGDEDPSDEEENAKDDLDFSGAALEARRAVMALQKTAHEKEKQDKSKA